VNVTENENVKMFFCSCLCKKWTDLRQTKAKMISGPFYTYHGWTTFHQRKCFVFSRPY